MAIIMSLSILMALIRKMADITLLYFYFFLASSFLRLRILARISARDPSTIISRYLLKTDGAEKLRSGRTPPLAKILHQHNIVVDLVRLPVEDPLTVRGDRQIGSAEWSPAFVKPDEGGCLTRSQVEQFDRRRRG